MRLVLLLTGCMLRACWVEIRDQVVEVRMSWQFCTTFFRKPIIEAAPDTDQTTGSGTHESRGMWLVNGTSKGLLRIRLAGPARVWVMGIPVPT